MGITTGVEEKVSTGWTVVVELADESVEDERVVWLWETTSRWLGFRWRLFSNRNGGSDLGYVEE